MSKKTMLILLLGVLVVIAVAYFASGDTFKGSFMGRGGPSLNTSKVQTRGSFDASQINKNNLEQEVQNQGRLAPRTAPETNPSTSPTSPNDDSIYEGKGCGVFCP